MKTSARHLTRATAAAAAGLLAVASLSACTGGGGGEASGDISGEITYAFWNRTQLPAIRQQAADFERQHPGVTVNLALTPFGTYWTKLQTQGQSGTLPDVFWMNNDYVNLYASNGLLAQSPSSIDMSVFNKEVVKSYQYDDKQYGVPSFQSALGVWYNKALLAKAGESVPKKDWTWDDFQKSAVAVSKKLGSDGVYGVSNDAIDGNSTYYATILQAGGQAISADGKKSGFDTPEGIAGLQFWRDLIADGANPDVNQLADTADIDWFLSGKSAYFWGISSYADKMSSSDIANDIDVAPLPVGKEAANPVGGLAVEISANTKNEATAKAFVEYLATEHAQSLLSPYTWPARLGSPQRLWQDKYDFNTQVFIDAQSIAKAPYPNMVNTADWQQAVQALMPDLLSGARPVDDIAAEISKNVDAVLAK